MASPESARIRRTIIRDRVSEGVSIEEERRDWERDAATLPLAAGVTQREERIAGLRCLWVADAADAHREVILYVHGGGLIAGSPRTHRAPPSGTRTGSIVACR